MTRELFQSGSRRVAETTFLRAPLKNDAPGLVVGARRPGGREHLVRPSAEEQLGARAGEPADGLAHPRVEGELRRPAGVLVDPVERDELVHLDASHAVPPVRCCAQVVALRCRRSGRSARSSRSTSKVKPCARSRSTRTSPSAVAGVQTPARRGQPVVEREGERRLAEHDRRAAVAGVVVGADPGAVARAGRRRRADLHAGSARQPAPRGSGPRPAWAGSGRGRHGSGRNAMPGHDAAETDGHATGQHRRHRSGAEVGRLAVAQVAAVGPVGQRVRQSHDAGVERRHDEGPGPPPGGRVAVDRHEPAQPVHDRRPRRPAAGPTTAPRNAGG